MMKTWCHINTLELPQCDMTGQDVENLTGVLTQCPALTHLNLSGNCFNKQGQRGLQKCWDSAQHLLVSISATIGSDQVGQSDLQDYWRSAQRWITSISSSNSQYHRCHCDNQIGTVGKGRSQPYQFQFHEQPSVCEAHRFLSFSF
jgi:hypothetical protein